MMNLHELRTRARSLGIKARRDWTKERFAHEVSRVEQQLDPSLLCLLKEKEDAEKVALKDTTGNIVADETSDSVKTIRNNTPNNFDIEGVIFPAYSVMMVSLERFSKYGIKKIYRALELKLFDEV